MNFVATKLDGVSGQDINDNGLVVGIAGTTTAAQKAFVADNGVINIIPVEGYNSQAKAIGPDNEIVGTATNSNRFGVYGWKQEAGQLTVIPGLGGTNCMPYDTNGNVIVGQASLASRIGRAFKHENGRTEDLGTLGGPAAVATAISATGVIVGQSRISTSNMVMRPFIVKDGVMSALGAQGTQNGFCYGVNDAGLAVGQDNGSAVLYDGNKTVVLSGGQGMAFAINNKGLVVGQVGNPGSATLWVDGRAIDLNQASTGLDGFVLLNAKSINNHNHIVAYGMKGNTFATFVLEPVA